MSSDDQQCNRLLTHYNSRLGYKNANTTKTVARQNSDSDGNTMIISPHMALTAKLMPCLHSSLFCLASIVYGKIVWCEHGQTNDELNNFRCIFFYFISGGSSSTFNTHSCPTHVVGVVGCGVYYKFVIVTPHLDLTHVHSRHTLFCHYRCRQLADRWDNHSCHIPNHNH